MGLGAKQIKTVDSWAEHLFLIIPWFGTIFYSVTWPVGNIHQISHCSLSVQICFWTGIGSCMCEFFCACDNCHSCHKSSQSTRCIWWKTRMIRFARFHPDKCFASDRNRFEAGNVSSEIVWYHAAALLGTTSTIRTHAMLSRRCRRVFRVLTRSFCPLPTVPVLSLLCRHDDLMQT